MVIQLTEEQAASLRGQEVSPSNLFHPIQDSNGVWIISIEEMNQCENENFAWLKDCPQIDYSPVTKE